MTEFSPNIISHENKESEVARRVARSGSELRLLNWSRLNWKWERAGPDQDWNRGVKILIIRKVCESLGLPGLEYGPAVSR